MKIKKFTLIISIIILLVKGATAGDGAASFLNIPIGARAAAMGGAGIAVVNDASAVYWNPARIGSLNGFAATSSMLSIKIGDNGQFDDIESKHYFVAAAIPVWKIGVFGIGWQNFSSGDIEHRSETGELLGQFDDSENAFFLAYGYPIVANQMNVGINFKFVQQKFTVLQDASANGVGFSLGMSYQVTHFLQMALRADDNFTMKWDNGHKDQALFKGIAGMALSLWNDNITMALDLEQIKNRPLKANYGVEFSYAPYFLRANKNTGVGSLAVRAGIDDLFLDDRGSGTEFQKQTNFTYGFGLGLLVSGVQLSIDYGFGSYRIGNQNRFTLSVFF
jgi:hypothetical protein